jgi:hypothetical protein
VDDELVLEAIYDVRESKHPAARKIDFLIQETIGDALQMCLHLAKTQTRMYTYIGITTGPLWRWARQGRTHEACSVSPHYRRWYSGRMHVVFAGTCAQCAVLEQRVIRHYQELDGSESREGLRGR